MIACRAYENALYARKSQIKTFSAFINIKMKTESTSRVKKDSASAQNKLKTHNGAKPEKVKVDRDTITALRRDNNTRVSKPKREYP